MGLFLVGLLAVPLAGTSYALTAQGNPRELDRTQVGIGYVANAPDQMVGGGAYVVTPALGGIGLYLDVKLDTSNPSDTQEYEGGITAQDVAQQVTGATFIEGESSYTSVNVALVRPLSPFLMVYGGGGIAQRTRFNEYEVPGDVSLGRGGLLWVEDPSQEESRVNLMLGLMMRVSSRITSHFGFETQPRGITAGMSLRIPSW